MTGKIEADTDLVVEYRIWSEKQAPTFPFVTVISPYIDCFLCQSWTSEGQLHLLVNLSTVLLNNITRKYITRSHTVCYVHLYYIISNEQRKLIYSFQELDFCSYQRRSHACFLGRAQGYGSSVSGAQSLRLLPTNTYTLREKGQGFWRGVEPRIESPVQSLDLCQPSTPK